MYNYYNNIILMNTRMMVSLWSMSEDNCTMDPVNIGIAAHSLTHSLTHSIFSQLCSGPPDFTVSNLFGINNLIMSCTVSYNNNNL